MLEELSLQLKRLLQHVRAVTTVNVNIAGSKELTLQLAKAYFANVRPTLLGHCDEIELQEVDALWQDLIRLTQGNNARTSYMTVLNRIQRKVQELLVEEVSRGGATDAPVIGLQIDDPLLQTIEALVPTAALAYRQGVADLNSERSSYRGTASEFREALRELLDHIAPDVDVLQQAGFQLEPGRAKPTMKQKVRFVLRSRGRSEGQSKTAEKSVQLIDELIGDITRACYDRASISSHVHTTRDEVGRLKRYVDTVLYDLLEIRG